MVAILAVLRAAAWDARHLLVQGVVGFSLSLVLTESFFFSQQDVPFNRPRMPGRTSLPLMLTLYVGVLPAFVLWISHMEIKMEKRPWELLLVALGAALFHATTEVLRGGPIEVVEEMEGYDGEFQLLGLS